jgi:hypothetical protein
MRAGRELFCGSATQLRFRGRVRAAGAFVTLLVLASCGGQSDDARYETARGIVDALSEGGLPCEDFRELEPVPEGVLDFGLCFLRGDPQYESDIYVYEDEDAAEAAAGGYERYEAIVVLHDSNWYITNGSRAQLEEMQEVLGGTILP